jgi:hypothetical protein
MPASADPLGLAGPGASAKSLAARQLALVNALVAGAAPPAGVDPERVHVQAQALLRIAVANLRTIVVSLART